MRVIWYNYHMKTQEISAEKLLGIIEEKDRRIVELEQQLQWFMTTNLTGSIHTRKNF